MALYCNSINVIASNYLVTILLPQSTLMLDTVHSHYVVKLFSKYNLNSLAIVSQICGETPTFQLKSTLSSPVYWTSVFQALHTIQFSPGDPQIFINYC